MHQSQYETIVKCIQYGAPALANDLIVSFNNTIQLANERASEMQEEQRRKTEEAMKKQQEENAKKDSQDSKVFKK